MLTATEIADRYIAMWNETDAEWRRSLIEHLWTDDGHYVDPALEAAGHPAIDAMVVAVHERFPGHRFRRTGPVDQHHDRLRFSWELAPEGGPALVVGVDFAVLDGERLRSVTGFFDSVPAAA